MKCSVQMRDKIIPVPGSVSGPEGKQTGTCPTCGTPGVVLGIVGGYVRAHVVAETAVPENNPQAAAPADTARRDASGRVMKVGKGLKEPQTDVSDTGVRVGDPRTAEGRRRVEVEAVTGTGTVQVPRKVDSGKKGKKGQTLYATRMTDVPATEAHVREALAYWQRKRTKTDGSRAKKLAMIEEMFRRLRAMSAQAPVMIVEGQARDTAAAHRGPTLIRGVAMEATEVTGPRERAEGDKPVRSTCEGPLGRVRPDRKIITVPEPPKVLSVSQKRRARRKTLGTALMAAAVAGE